MNTNYKLSLCKSVLYCLGTAAGFNREQQAQGKGGTSREGRIQVTRKGSRVSQAEEDEETVRLATEHVSKQTLEQETVYTEWTFIYSLCWLLIKL